MKHALFGLGFLLFILHPVQGQAPSSRPSANELLGQATNNMAKLGSYHVDVEITTPVGKATLVGDLGTGSLSFKGKDAKDVRKQRILTDKVFYLSLDDGKSWKSGDEADRDGTIFLSNVVTGPISPELKVWEKGMFSATKEAVNGESLLKVEKPAKGKEPAVTYWVVREPQLDNAAFIRKVQMTLSTGAGDLPVTVRYTKLNVPVEIKAPPLK